MTALSHDAPHLLDPIDDPTDVLRRGVQFERADDLPAAEAAYRAADAMGSPEGATALGRLLEERDDLEGAAAAFRRAAQRGHGDGAFHLGWLLRERGDLTGAAGAYRDAVELGHPAAAASLRLVQDASPAPSPAMTQASSLDDEAADLARRALAEAAAADALPSAPELTAPTTRRHPRARKRLTSAAMIVPIAAFAGAFMLGTGGHRATSAPLHVAPAASITEGPVTIASVTHVPQPRPLPRVTRRRHKHPAAHATSSASAPAAATYSAPAPVYYAPVAHTPVASTHTGSAAHQSSSTASTPSTGAGSHGASAGAGHGAGGSGTVTGGG